MNLKKCCMIMITPQRMSEFEKNKIIDMFSKLNQDLTSSIIKKL